MLKKLSPVFFVLLILVPFLSVFTPRVSAADAITSAEDYHKQRYILAAGSECVNQSVIDEDDKIDGADLEHEYNDLFDDFGREQQVIIGIDMEKTNGAVSCAHTMKEALVYAGKASSTDDAMAYFIKRLTGQDFRQGQDISFDKDTLLNNARTLGTELINAQHANRVSNDLVREQLAPLVTICFTGSNTKPSNYDERRGDFTYGGKYYQQKDNMDWKSFPWISEQKQTILGHSTPVGKHHPYIGDHELDFSTGGTVNGDQFHEDASSDSSQFYPIGYYGAQGGNHIANCPDVKRHASVIFTGNETIDDKTGKITFKNADGSTIDTDTVTKPSTDATDDNSCESRGGPLGWIMCPVIRVISAGLNWIDTQIQALLEIDSTAYNNPGLHSGAVKIRNVAYVILIPIMLVMVIGTALGSDFVSAYTVKKALPRMVIAIIFITLSWYLCTFLITLSNAVGGGVLGLVTQPFPGHTTLASFFEGNIAEGLASAIVAIPAAILVIWLFGGTLLLFIGIALLVLILRQMFVIGFLLAAPLAILAWIFPGHDKIWKDWWSGFSKLLIMYPLITGLIGLGRVFAVIVKDGATGSGPLAGLAIRPLFIMAAYILPYALIPLTFKFAGGAFATLSGAVNDRSKGAFDRQRKKRAENWGGFKSGTKAPPGLRGNWAGARGMQRIGSGIGSGARGRFGFGQVGREKRSRLSEMAADDIMKNDKELQSLALNSDEGIAIAALSGGTSSGAEQASQDLMSGWLRDNNEYQTALATGDTATQRRIEGEQEERRQRGLAAAKAVGLDKGKAQAAMSLMMQNKARAVGVGDWQTVQRGINRLAGGNAAQATNLAGTVQYNARGNGRADLGAGTVAGGYGRIHPSQLVQGHGNAVRAVTQDLQQRMDTAMATGDREAAMAASAEIAALRGAMGSATVENRAILADFLSNGVGIDLSSPQTVAQQLASGISAGLGGTAPGRQALGNASEADLAAEIHLRAGAYEQSTLAGRAEQDANNPGAPPVTGPRS